MEYYRTMGYDHSSIIWCVTEKVHGSQFSYYINKNEVKTAKRKGFLRNGENFMNYLRMSKDTNYKVINLWNDLKAIIPNLNEVVLFGELFGGWYSHPDVPKIPNIKRIQKGVDYHPDIKFYCFDMMIDGESVSHGVLQMICERNDIFCARILFKGTLDECLKYPNKFQTNIPKWLHLPEIEGNICEGIVLKPVVPLFDLHHDRVILKSKNEKFMEKAKAKKDLQIEPVDLSELGKQALEKITDYINENRLRSVLSKEGNFTKKDFNKILGLFKRDIYEDFTSECNDLNQIERNERKLIDKSVSNICISIWKPIFLSEAE